MMENIIHLSIFSTITVCGSLIYAEEVDSKEVLESAKTECLDCADNRCTNNEAAEPVVVSTEQDN